MEKIKISSFNELGKNFVEAPQPDGTCKRFTMIGLFCFEAVYDIASGEVLFLSADNEELPITLESVKKIYELAQKGIRSKKALDEAMTPRKKELCAYRKAAQKAMIQFDKLDADDAYTRARDEDLDTLESHTYVRTSLDPALIAIAQYLNLTSLEFEELRKEVFTGTGDKKVLEKIQEKMGKIRNKEMFTIQILSDVHDHWIEQNGSDIKLEKKTNNKQLFQYTPLELIGWEEAKKDLLFVLPILEVLGYIPKEKELDIQYHRRVAFYLGEYHIHDFKTVQEMIAGGEGYFSDMDEKVLSHLKRHLSEVMEQIQTNLKENDAESYEMVQNFQTVQSNHKQYIIQF